MQTSDYARLRLRIISTILGFSLIPLFGLGSFIYFQFSKTFDDNVAENLSTIVENKRDALDMFLTERVIQLKNLAYTHKWNEMSNDEYLHNLFEIIRSYSGSIVDLGVIDSTGQQVSYSGPYKLKGVDYKDERWFRQVRLKGMYISDVFMGFRHFPHFIIAVWRQEKGHSWILRATIDSDVFTSLVRNVQVGRRGDAFLVNRGNVLQTSPRFGAKVLEQAHLPDLPERLDSAEISWLHGNDKIVAGFARLRQVDWTLVITEDPSEEMSPLVRTQWTALGITGLGGLLIFLGGWAVSRNIVSKIEAADRQKAAMDATLMQSGKMAALGKMAAGVAHEVNNPLTLIRESAGWARDLLTEEDPEKITNFTEIEAALHKIDEHVERARNITRRMLGFAKRMDPTQENVDLNNLAEQTIMLLGNEALHRNINIETDLAVGLGSIETDPSQVQQVVLNLLENAIDAIDRNGTINLHTWRDEEHKHLCLSVTDTGPGIPPELCNKVFDPFFSTKKIGEGTGLGLAISYSIMEKLGGTIAANNVEGGGACFTICLPM
ncbi:MAG: sensor histidine kinase [Desulfovibrio sp.]|uniref:sensor histidine kinase n=1 Tax=Desulfovibrio sp. 7SRBS1 TaxID=3378064 RepID=UPI003B3E08EA